MPRGVIMKRDLGGMAMADQEKVTEHVTRAWYEDGSPNIRTRAKPNRSGKSGIPAGDGKYTWFKAPRYEGEPCEVGPLARVLVAYGNRQ